MANRQEIVCTYIYENYVQFDLDDIDELQRHPYIRYNQAKAIYALRRQRIRFQSLDDLRALPELTREELLKIAPYLSFE